jgi:hypothetical protein
LPSQRYPRRLRDATIAAPAAANLAREARAERNARTVADVCRQKEACDAKETDAAGSAKPSRPAKDLHVER